MAEWSLVTENRYHSLDFIRGIAVLGIFVINVETFCYPDAFSSTAFGFQSALDHDVRFWVYFLFQGKFFGVFALLFAVGFDIFLGNLDRKGLGLRSMDVYGRRLFWLFIIGLLHSIFLWTGDILHHYAICGLLLIPFRSFSQKWLLVSIIGLALVLLYNDYTKVVLRKERYAAYLKARDVADDQKSSEQKKSVDLWKQMTSIGEPKTADDHPRKNDYWTNLQENFKQLKFNQGRVFYSGILLRTLLLMLVGVWLFRMKLFENYHTIHGYWLWTLGVLIIGLVMNYWRSDQWTYHSSQPVLSLWQQWIETLAKEILAVGYVLLINGCYQVFKQPVVLINAIGKMALSVYLFQTVIGLLFFYGYGLGYYNDLTRAELLIFVSVAWVFQLVLVWLYAKKFTQGPIERMWRKLTYQAA